MNEPENITIDELIERYPVLLFDAYGVLVYSNEAMPGAADLIKRLNHEGHEYYVLTNDASALPEARASRYHQHNLFMNPERIITSGALLEGYFKEHNLQGSDCVVLGTEDSKLYVELAGGNVVEPTVPFDVLIPADQEGFPFIETVDAVLSQLYRSLDKGDDVKLVMPNPDLVYPDLNGFGFATGTIGAMFEAALKLRYPERNDLNFVRLGKPHSTIFAEAHNRSGTMDMVMVGDTLATDIAGANNYGIDSVLIATGVTTTSLSNVPDNLRPTYTMRSL